MCLTRLVWGLSVSFAILLSGCPVPTLIHPAAHEMSDQQVAILKDRWGACAFCVVGIWSDKGQRLVYHVGRDGFAEAFKLPPGRYIVEYTTVPYKIARVWRKDSVELKAGHIYKVKDLACYHVPSYPACQGRGYRATLWIEDETTGEVIAGEQWR